MKRKLTIYPGIGGACAINAFMYVQRINITCIKKRSGSKGEYKNVEKKGTLNSTLFSF